MHSTTNFCLLGKLVLLTVCFTFLGISLLGQSNVCGTRKVCISEQFAIRELCHAQQARESGNMQDAELHWSCAQNFNRKDSLARPAWLNKKNLEIPDPILPSMQERLARIASLPYEIAGMLLEDILEQHPDNVQARELYLNLAIVHGDRQQERNHRCILRDCQAIDWKARLWNFVFIFLLFIIVTQLIALNCRVRHEKCVSSAIKNVKGIKL